MTRDPKSGGFVHAGRFSYPPVDTWIHFYGYNNKGFKVLTFKIDLVLPMSSGVISGMSGLVSILPKRQTPSGLRAFALTAPWT